MLYKPKFLSPAMTNETKYFEKNDLNQYIFSCICDGNEKVVEGILNIELNKTEEGFRKTSIEKEAFKLKDITGITLGFAPIRIEMEKTVNNNYTPKTTVNDIIFDSSNPILINKIRLGTGSYEETGVIGGLLSLYKSEVISLAQESISTSNNPKPPYEVCGINLKNLSINMENNKSMQNIINNNQTVESVILAPTQGYFRSDNDIITLDLSATADNIGKDKRIIEGVWNLNIPDNLQVSLGELGGQLEEYSETNIIENNGKYYTEATFSISTTISIDYIEVLFKKNTITGSSFNTDFPKIKYKESQVFNFDFNNYPIGFDNEYYIFNFNIETYLPLEEEFSWKITLKSENETQVISTVEKTLIINPVKIIVNEKEDIESISIDNYLVLDADIKSYYPTQYYYYKFINMKTGKNVYTSDKIYSPVIHIEYDNFYVNHNYQLEIYVTNSLNVTTVKTIAIYNSSPLQITHIPCHLTQNPYDTSLLLQIEGLNELNVITQGQDLVHEFKEDGYKNANDVFCQNSNYVCTLTKQTEFYQVTGDNIQTKGLIWCCHFDNFPSKSDNPQVFTTFTLNNQTYSLAIQINSADTVEVFCVEVPELSISLPTYWHKDYWYIFYAGIVNDKIEMYVRKIRSKTQFSYIPNKENNKNHPEQYHNIIYNKNNSNMNQAAVLRNGLYCDDMNYFFRFKHFDINVNTNDLTENDIFSIANLSNFKIQGIKSGKIDVSYFCALNDNIDNLDVLNLLFPIDNPYKSPLNSINVQPYWYWGFVDKTLENNIYKWTRINPISDSFYKMFVLSLNFEEDTLSNKTQYWLEDMNPYVIKKDKFTIGDIGIFSNDVVGIDVKRRDIVTGHIVNIETIDKKQKSYNVLDYGAKSGRLYEYYIYLKNTNGKRSVITTEQFTPNWDKWVLFTADEGANKNEMLVDQIFLFDLNISSGSMSNNNERTVIKNFTAYPRIQKSPYNYWSGTLKGLLGYIAPNLVTYIQTPEQLEEFKELSVNNKRKFLKDRDGNLFEVEISGPLTIDNTDNLCIDLKTKSISWVEVANTENISLIIKDNNQINWLLNKNGYGNLMTQYRWDDTSEWQDSSLWIEGVR